MVVLGGVPGGLAGTGWGGVACAQATGAALPASNPLRAVKNRVSEKALQPCRPQVPSAPGTRRAEGAQSQAPTTAHTSRKRRAARSTEVRGRVRVLDTVVASQGSGSPERQGGTDELGAEACNLAVSRRRGRQPGKRL